MANTMNDFIRFTGALPEDSESGKCHMFDFQVWKLRVSDNTKPQGTEKRCIRNHVASAY